MPSIGPMEIALVAVVALLVFGPSRLPEMARTLGRAVNEFRRQANDLKSEFSASLDDDDDSRTPAPGAATAPTGTSAPEDARPTASPDGGASDEADDASDRGAGGP